MDLQKHFLKPTGDKMKILILLERIKWFIYDHLPATKGELLELSEMVLEMVEATQEYELLIRNDMRLLFNEMQAKKEKPKETKKNVNDNMFG